MRILETLWGIIVLLFYATLFFGFLFLISGFLYTNHVLEVEINKAELKELEK